MTSHKVATGLCLLFAAALLRAQPGPAGPVGPNLRLNGPQSPMPAGRLGRPGETIAADPTGRLLVAAWETLAGSCGPPFGAACPPPKSPGMIAVGTSTDGGRTWSEAGSPFLGGNVMTAGHPWLDRGGVDNQTFFLSSRARTTGTTAEDITPGGSGQLGIVLYRGRFKDGVLTWTDRHLFNPTKPGDLWRSPSVLAAKDGSGKVFVTFTILQGVCGLPGRSAGQIEVFRSLDEGRSWEGPVLVSPDDTVLTPDPKDPLCGVTGTFQISSSAALGSGGEVYVVWQFGPRAVLFDPTKDYQIIPTLSVRFSRSVDGGRTFSTPHDLVSALSMHENQPAGYSKGNLTDFPRIAVATGGPHRGRIYVTYASAVAPATPPAEEQSPISSQVYLLHSDDRGETWSAPLPLAAAVPPTGLKRFWPTVAVRQDGTVDVIYMESEEKQVTPDPDDVECKTALVGGSTRSGKRSSLVDVYWVRSTDSGASFGPPVRVTSETSNWCKVAYDRQGPQFANFGDFLGIVAAGNLTYAVWPDGRNGVPEAYFAELGGVGGSARRLP